MDINKTIKGEVGIFNTMIASGPVIIQERDGVEKTLLVKHGDKPLSELKWKFCGGKVALNSSLEENAIREAKEEIGVEVKLIKALKPMILWQETPETGSEKPEAIVLIHYLASVDQEPVPGPQTLAMDWFDIHNLPEGCAPNVMPLIEDYLKQK
ncbi:MAG: NUDIX hydrolase [Patescibacteria group bacterium]